ncbi:rhodanese-like domain-containing protein [Hyphomonas sp.]|jgi:rhodanese-related sulfurtransferase|uniref:rhodanese-like domain-containing protein n=1 Tax=Hyphomonas sp. TaxID=87 RepID=UPI0035618767
MRVQFLGLVCGALGFGGAAMADVETLSADSAFQMSQKGELILIDVRTPSEWAMTGMPRDSVGATLQDIDFVARARGAVYGDLEQPVAVICKSGNRSTSAAEKLAAEGFAHVFNVTEGMTGHLGSGDGWIKRGLPTDPFNPPMR